MMLESMRNASIGDPMFGSDQGDMYQDMADDQLAVQMSEGPGPRPRRHAHPPVERRRRQRIGRRQAGADADDRSVTPEEREQFISELCRTPTAAARELGVDPRNLIAQAALETGWGRSQPGGDSHNLFGIKAGANWNGASVQANTQEFDAGVASRSRRELSRLRVAPRERRRLCPPDSRQPALRGRMNTGSDVQAFANALQRGGYATDPDYARKLAAVAAEVGQRIAANPFKSDSAAPIAGQDPSRMSNG